MPGGGEEKVFTLLKGFSEQWKDRGEGAERENEVTMNGGWRRG